MRPKQFLLYYELEYRKCFDASKSSGKSTQTLQSISKKNNYNESHHGRENFFENFRKQVKPDSSKC